MLMNIALKITKTIFFFNIYPHINISGTLSLYRYRFASGIIFLLPGELPLTFACLSNFLRLKIFLFYLHF